MKECNHRCIASQNALFLGHQVAKQQRLSYSFLGLLGKEARNDRPTSNYEDKLRKQAAAELAGQGEQLIFKLSVKVKHTCVVQPSYRKGQCLLSALAQVGSLLHHIHSMYMHATRRRRLTKISLQSACKGRVRSISYIMDGLLLYSVYRLHTTCFSSGQQQLIAQLLKPSSY